MTNEVINVEGMSCDHCKHSIEKALNGLDGVTSSEVSLANGNVEVEFDENQVAFNDFKAVSYTHLTLPTIYTV